MNLLRKRYLVAKEEKNIFCYIDSRLAVDDSVADGHEPRCQPHLTAEISQRQAIQSIQNLDAAMKMADSGEASTKNIINKLKGSVKCGGVYGVAPFYAQVLINLVTKLGLIRDHRHVAHITVSPSTATYKQLKSVYGVRSAAHAAEIVPFLVNKTGMLPVTCENRLCKVLHVDFGVKDDVQDVFFKGDVLYKLEGGDVWTINVHGVRMKMVYAECSIITKYCPNVAWWDGKITFGKTAHAWDHVLITLKLKRKREDNLS